MKSAPRGERGPTEARSVSIELDAAPYAEGSCLISTGGTRVLCSASIQEELPAWRAASGKGWITGEYAMLPRSTHTRRSRERAGADGRTREIERLIGRSLRSVADLSALGPRMIVVDCDVLVADGGTRTAAITGGFIALALAVEHLVGSGAIESTLLRESVAAVSVGLVDGVPTLDLDYRQDSSAEVDMNVVATGAGNLVEVQGTGERRSFSRSELDALLDLAFSGIANLVEVQRSTLASRGIPLPQV